MNKDQLKEIRSRLKYLISEEVEEGLLDKYEVESLEDLKSSDYDDIIEFIRKY
jgi:hypothetical protein